MLNRELFDFMERAAPWLVLWSFGFTCITTVRIARRVSRGVASVPDSAAYTELAGLPLTLLQSVCFAWAVWAGDWLSMLLFVWWGPGFIAVAVLVITAKRRAKPIDWHKWRYAISFLCKGYYLAYVAAFLHMGTPLILFAFSVWIINDQYEKAFMSLDADRLRRTFDDYWLFRVLYPAGLLVPLFYSATRAQPWLVVYALLLLSLWLAGVIYVWRKGLLRQRPADTSLLRNMVYFPKLRQ
jgi:hypothetical protein